MAIKTHKTAVVLIPPESVWEPIQRIRRRYDRQIRRWMPHVTLLYPFRPLEEFPELASRLIDVCRRMEPFQIDLSDFRWFQHGARSFTMWLSPEPGAKLRLLQDALQAKVPDCNDARRHPGGYTPHLSVGQLRDRQRLPSLVASLQESWAPAQFVAEEISLIARDDPPDDVFRVIHTIPLGSAQSAQTSSDR